MSRAAWRSDSRTFAACARRADPSYFLLTPRTGTLHTRRIDTDYCNEIEEHMSTAAHPFLVRLQQATESHDLDALVDCFDPGYRNETPAHPGRSFEGVEQVRANWSQIFA